MKLYRLVPNRKYSSASRISAARQSVLPGVRCSLCGNTWAATGIIYPTISDREIEIINQGTFEPVVDEITFRGISQQVNSALEKKRLLLPGTELGRLTGNIIGDDTDNFVWRNPWTPLIKKSLHVEFEKAHRISLDGNAAILGGKNSFVEMEASPCLKLNKACVHSDPCESCGRNGIKYPKKIIIDKTTVKPDLLISRIYGLWTTIIVNNVLYDFLKEKNFSEFSMEPIDIE